ncbi:MAG: retroviral-like aspartic protease family protein [Acidimicrobiaceae bacterium]|nr:retroviral-like aspartic protease family protein [Acidimicrobiaceae bacterium]
MPTISVAAQDGKVLIGVAVLVPRSARQDPEPFQALVDTGAQVSAIGPRVVERFGADPYLTTTMRTASGVAEPAHLYRAIIGVTAPDTDAANFLWVPVNAVGLPRAQPGYDVIVGLDILARVHASLIEGTLTLSY